MTMLTQAEIASMRGTVENVALIHRCTIERRTAGTVDDLGNPTYTWTNLATNVPCFLWEANEDEVVGAQVQGVFAGSHVQFEARTDITAADRIRNVVALDGTTRAALLHIEEVVHTETDTVAAVEEVSS